VLDVPQGVVYNSLSKPIRKRPGGERSQSLVGGDKKKHRKKVKKHWQKKRRRAQRHKKRK
jgi:hypothetical protein